jgi:peptide/nickel transport system ATP-binding protein
MRIGDQLMEAAARTNARSTLKARAMEMLEQVKIRDPERVFRAWPHELSGGMGQRVMIAMMLVTEPELLIADEPTSALDVTVRLQVLAILDDLVKTRNMGLIFISHDLNLVSSFCDRVLVMYAGQIMEKLDAKRLSEAKHPYTRGLLACTPNLEKPVDVLPTLQRDPSWMAPVSR